MKIDFTYEMVFSFGGPNLCVLGNEDDFKNLAKLILDLTTPGSTLDVELLKSGLFESVGTYKDVIFSSKPGAISLGKLKDEKLIFELDSRNWERLFKFFVLMSWDKRTYYLNAYEDYLEDLNLEQECNFICSSEF